MSYQPLLIHLPWRIGSTLSQILLLKMVFINSRNGILSILDNLFIDKIVPSWSSCNKVFGKDKH